MKTFPYPAVALGVRVSWLSPPLPEGARAAANPDPQIVQGRAWAGPNPALGGSEQVAVMPPRVCQPTGGLAAQPGPEFSSRSNACGLCKALRSECDCSCRADLSKQPLLRLSVSIRAAGLGADTDGEVGCGPPRTTPR